jgi:hypothetical protein
MSLTELILRHLDRAEVRTVPRLDPGAAPRAHGGTAFDCVVRLELQHRAPRAISVHWIAVLSRTNRTKAKRTMRAARRACAALPAAEAAGFGILAEHSARLAPLDLVHGAGISTFQGSKPGRAADLKIDRRVTRTLDDHNPRQGRATTPKVRRPPPQRASGEPAPGCERVRARLARPPRCAPLRPRIRPCHRAYDR